MANSLSVLTNNLYKYSETVAALGNTIIDVSAFAQQARAKPITVMVEKAATIEVTAAAVPDLDTTGAWRNVTDLTASAQDAKVIDFPCTGIRITDTANSTDNDIEVLVGK